MRGARHIILPLILAFICSSGLAEESSKLLVISNVPLEGEINRKKLKQIYLEDGINFPVRPLNMKSGSRSRSIFNAKIIGLTESRIKAYWAQMKFTGRVSPPKEFATTDELISFLNANPGYLAYVPATTEIPESLQVVFTF
jgi:hypothetical protein